MAKERTSKALAGGFAGVDGTLLYRLLPFGDPANLSS